MKLLGAALVLLVVAVGCGGKKGDDFAPLVERAARFEKNACACKDKACADAEQHGFSEFLSGYKTVDPPESVTKPVKASIDKAHACIDAFDPPAEETPPAVPEAPTTQSLLDAMERLKTEVCNCKDLACAQVVQAKLTELTGRFSNVSDVPTEAQFERSAALGTAMSECMMKVPTTP